MVTYISVIKSNRNDHAGGCGGDRQDHARSLPDYVLRRRFGGQELGLHGAYDRAGEFPKRHLDEWRALYVLDPDGIVEHTWPSETRLDGKSEHKRHMVTFLKPFAWFSNE